MKKECEHKYINQRWEETALNRNTATPFFFVIGIMKCEKCGKIKRINANNSY